MRDTRNCISLLLVTIALSACTFWGDSESFRKVTYKVESCGIPCTLLIVYDDEAGRQVEVSRESKWEQTVRLPTGKIATINVTAIIDVNKYFDLPTTFFQEEEKDGLPSVPINVRISQRRHQVLSSGYGTLCTSMDDLEAISF